FNVCAQIRRGQFGQNLRVLLLSSDTNREGLTQHAHSQNAADGYLVIPFDMGELAQMAQEVLPPESAAAPEQHAEGLDNELENALTGTGPSYSPPPLPPTSTPPAGAPPKLPRRERRSAITEEDRAFLDRAFQSLAERKAELLAESRQLKRPTVRPELKGTPEGKIQMLREELKHREAQVARIGEIWSVRERELLTVEDRLHDKDVEVQSVKMQLEELQRRLMEAKAGFEQREREHGAAVQELLEQKFVGEKEVIETVSAKEKELYVLRRELTAREEEIAQQTQALESRAREYEELEKQLNVLTLEGEVREKNLQETIEAREQELAANAQAIEELQQELDRTVADRDQRLSELNGEREALQEALESARNEREQTVSDLENRLAEAAQREAEAAEAYERLTQDRAQSEQQLNEQLSELE